MLTTSAWIDILAVGGTWYRKHRQQAPQWCDPDHPLTWFLHARGFRWLVGHGGRRFDWTGRINGWQFWRRWTRWFKNEPDRTDWEIDGQHLYNLVDPPFAHDHALPGRRLHVWAHSHGGNVVFYACAQGMKVNVLVTFCTPVREDMLPIIRRARPNIDHWIHVYSDGSDLMQILGEVGDGTIAVRRRFDHDGQCRDDHHHLVDDYVFVDDGHSAVLNDASRFDRLDRILGVITERHDRDDYLSRTR